MWKPNRNWIQIMFSGGKTDNLKKVNSVAVSMFTYLRSHRNYLIWNFFSINSIQIKQSFLICFLLSTSGNQYFDCSLYGLKYSERFYINAGRKYVTISFACCCFQILLDMASRLIGIWCNHFALSTSDIKVFSFKYYREICFWSLLQKRFSKTSFTW